MSLELLKILYKLTTAIKGGVDILNYEDSTEHKLYQRVYNAEIQKILRSAGSREVDEHSFMEHYRIVISKEDVTGRPLQVRQDLLGQVQYVLEEKNLGDFGQLRMHALQWAIRNHKEEYESEWKKGNHIDYLYKKYSELLYEQYTKRYLRRKTENRG